MNETITWLNQNAMLLLPLLAGAVAVWWMLPKYQRRRPLSAGLIGLATLAALGAIWLRPSGEWVHDLPFYLFAACAVGSAALMITDRDPVHAALWFALATLSVCGLFLLRSAAFLAAATVIVYAGAIIVVFLFVIMLARQAGEARYDQQSVQPFAASVLVFVLLGTMLFSLEAWRTGHSMSSSEGTEVAETEVAETGPKFLPPPDSLKGNVLSEPVEGAEYGTLRGLGRSLFGDYLFEVEIAGTLLVVAAVGAIAIAPRTRRGTL